jgi:hypothetical protein
MKCIQILYNSEIQDASQITELTGLQPLLHESCYGSYDECDRVLGVNHT